MEQKVAPPSQEKAAVISHDHLASGRAISSRNGAGDADGNGNGNGVNDQISAEPRKVPGVIPLTAFLLCLAECAERASYYGVRTVFSNFMQFPLPVGGNGAGAPPPGQKSAGALGRGLQFSNAFILLFQFLVCVVPIFGGWLADVKLGRYKVITIGVWIGLVSHILMAASAHPSLLQSGRATAPFMISFFLLALGTGLFKPNIIPMIVDQYPSHKPYTHTLPSSGEAVLVDPETTVQRIILICYGLINVGALFGIPMAFSAKKIGFWLAFLAPGVVYLPIPVLLLVFRRRLLAATPGPGKNKKGGDDLARAFQIIGFALRKNRFRFWAANFWDIAIPSTSTSTSTSGNLDTNTDSNTSRDVIRDNGNRNWKWTAHDVQTTRRALSACQIFLFLFPLYHLNNGGIGSISTSQAASLTTNGAPNDLLNNLNPLVIIFFTPLLTHVVYPLLASYKVNFSRGKRMTFGFTLAILSSLSGAFLQWRVYKTSPCGEFATACDIGTGVSPISVWWQVPVIAFGAISECFCQVTAYELAYARAPVNGKALVTALLLFSNALASVLGLVITPVVKDPYLVWVWLGPAVALFLQTCWFQWKYREIDIDEFMVFEEEEEVDAGRV